MLQPMSERSQNQNSSPVVLTTTETFIYLDKNEKELIKKTNKPYILKLIKFYFYT